MLRMIIKKKAEEIERRNGELNYVFHFLGSYVALDFTDTSFAFIE